MVGPSMATFYCGVLDDYQGVALASADWTALGPDVHIEVFRDHFSNDDQLVEGLLHCDAVVLMRERTPLQPAVIERLHRLKLIVTTGMRNASIALDAAKARNITVCGTASRSTPPAELTWALILGLARHITTEASALRRSGPWQQTIGTDLAGNNLGLLGLGKVGSQVAAVGLAFGMKVAAWSQNLTADRARELGVQLATSKEELIGTSDFLSIHLVLSSRTAGLVGAKELDLMRPTAYLINTSRANIVCHDALIAALRDGRIAGAGLDVFAEEPLPLDHPWRGVPNVLATPHLGYVTAANYRQYYHQAVEDIAAFIDGHPLRVLA